MTPKLVLVKLLSLSLSRGIDLLGVGIGEKREYYYYYVGGYCRMDNSNSDRQRKQQLLTGVVDVDDDDVTFFGSVLLNGEGRAKSFIET